MTYEDDPNIKHPLKPIRQHFKVQLKWRIDAWKRDWHAQLVNEWERKGFYDEIDSHKRGKFGRKTKFSWIKQAGNSRVDNEKQQRTTNQDNALAMYDSI